MVVNKKGLIYQLVKCSISVSLMLNTGADVLVME